MKKPKQKDFFRAKIVEKLAQSKVKVICLDNGYYEKCSEQDLLELIDEFKRKPAYKAKKCFHIGLQPVGLSNGKWASMAERYTSETLNDHYVQVVFMNDKPTNDTYEVCIYVDTKQKCFLSNETSIDENEYVRFADLLNSRGLALLKEKQPLDMLLANKNSINLSALVCPQDKHEFFKYPDLPEVVYNDLQKNNGKSYDVLITSIEHDTEANDLFIYVLLVKLMPSCDLLKTMQENFEECYKSARGNDLRFSFKFLIDSAKQLNYLACVVCVDSKYYRAEILTYELNESFSVRLVDYGLIQTVHFNSIFRPMKKYAQVERQAFKVNINFRLDETVESLVKDINVKECQSLFQNKLAKLKVDTILNAQEVEEQQGSLIKGDLLISHLGIYLSEYYTDKESENTLKNFQKYNKTSDVVFNFDGMCFNVIVSWIENIDNVNFNKYLNIHIILF